MHVVYVCVVPCHPDHWVIQFLNDLSSGMKWKTIYKANEIETKRKFDKGRIKEAIKEEERKWKNSRDIMIM